MGMDCHMFNQVHCEKTIRKPSPVPQPLAQKAPLAASHRLTNPSAEQSGFTLVTHCIIFLIPEKQVNLTSYFFQFNLY